MLPADWRDAEGVCWARYQAQQLWDGEEYVLMIDSHMRFVPGWDDLMIKELAKVLEQVDTIELAGEPQWTGAHFVSGLKHLPISYTLK